jgi:hypothetical protein
LKSLMEQPGHFSTFIKVISFRDILSLLRQWNRIPFVKIKI